jgi:hypothetical protein
MDKRKHLCSITSMRARQQAKLDKLKKYLYLKDTYGILSKDIQSYSLVPSGRARDGKPIYFSNINMKDGSIVKIKENIEDLLGLC